MKLAKLSVGSSTAERIDAIREFLRREHGIETGGSPASPSEHRVLHALLAALGPDRKRVFSQNRLLAADELKLEGDRTVFYVENQGVFKWAVERGEDPPVWELLVETREWRKAAETLSCFLINALLLETNLSAPCRARAADVTEEQRVRLLELLEPVRLEPIPWLGGAEYAIRDGVVAWIGPEGSGVEIAGRDEECMEFVWDVSDDSWEMDI